MKAMIPAAVLAGALAVCVSPASAAPINVFNGMATTPVYTSGPGGLDPNTFELNVASNTTMMTRLVDTNRDLDPNVSWKVEYRIYEDALAGAGYSEGALVDSFSFTDATYSGTNPSPWHYTNIALGGEYLLKMWTVAAASGLVAPALSSDSEISAVPLPGAALLFGSALLGVGALRRKQTAGKVA